MSGMSPSIRTVLDRHANVIAPASFEFAERIFSTEQSNYEKRLRQIGFGECNHVLDAGCGFGQWSLALARMGVEVDAVDVASDRLMVLAEIMAMLGISNIRLRYGQLLTLPFGDNIFDGILCYGVLHIVPWREALREFRRVLKPGGRLYFTANDIGYYIHVWRNRPNATVDNDPRKPAAYALYNAYRYANGLDIEGGCGAFIDPQEILVELEESGFIEVQKGGEGCLQHPNWSGPVGPSFFQESYDGLPGVYEILATRG